MSDALAIGVDVGGTKVEGLVVDLGDGGRVLDRRLVPTPALSQEASVETILAVARELMASHPEIRAVGVGAAGMVDLRGIMRFAPNIAWREFPLAEQLGLALGMATLVDHDATVSGAGAIRSGPRQASQDVLM